MGCASVTCGFTFVLERELRQLIVPFNFILLSNFPENLFTFFQILLATLFSSVWAIVIDRMYL